jgi:hypothetical protein
VAHFGRFCSAQVLEKAYHIHPTQRDVALFVGGDAEACAQLLELLTSRVMDDTHVTEVSGTGRKALLSSDATEVVLVLFELSTTIYGAIISSLLVVFVPQNCNGHVCNVHDNTHDLTRTNTAALVINFVTLGVVVLAVLCFGYRGAQMIVRVDPCFLTFFRVPHHSGFRY